MIRPAAVPALPVEVQNAIVIGIGHNVTRRPRTNHEIPNLCVTVVLHTMSDWITGFECCGVGFAAPHVRWPWDRPWCRFPRAVS